MLQGVKEITQFMVNALWAVIFLLCDLHDTYKL